MTDERLGMAAGAWLRDIDRPARDSQASVQQAMTQVRTTRQVRRWWPFTTTSGHEPARGFTMFSALKYVAAGVIVALFGGFLLAGVLTTQQGEEALPAAVTESPTTEATGEPTDEPATSVRTDILPGLGLTVEAVEPGVLRVVNDGVRDLSKANNTGIAVGHDGGIWLLRAQRFFRLGSDERHEWTRKVSKFLSDFLVAPDGTAWTIEAQKLRSFDGETWTYHHHTVRATALDVDADGKVWTAARSHEDPSTMVVGYLDGDVWQPIGEFDYSGGYSPGPKATVSSTGDVWVVSVVREDSETRTDLQRYVDGAWRATAWQPPGLTTSMSVDAGPDGTFWGMRDRGDGLFRFDGEGWAAWDVLGVSAGFDGVTGPFEVAPDGSLWVGWRVNDKLRDRQTAPGSEGFRCDGVRRFDGARWDHYLRDMCVASGPVLDISTDGSVWVLASETKGGKGPVDLYVITPEAVAATE